MSCLVYCVLHHSDRPKDKLPPGVGGEAVSFVAEDGLAAAFSIVPDVPVAAESRRIVAYARVIEALHRSCVVLPVRYGCLFRHQEQLSTFLREHRTEFGDLLAELEGCAEMGVRALVPAARRLVLPDWGSAAASSSGAAYLASRRAAYAKKDGESEHCAAVVDAIRQAFASCAVRCRTEHRSTNQGALVSLYFLVRRNQLCRFRRTFWGFQQQADRKLLLTGPWPPYNFVSGKLPKESS